MVTHEADIDRTEVSMIRWKYGFSQSTSTYSALEVSHCMRYTNILTYLRT